MNITLYDLVDLIGAKIEMSRQNNGRVMWMATLGRWEIRVNNSIVSSICGYGNTPEETLNDLVKCIKGKTIELPNRENRQTFNVPIGLYHLENTTNYR
jgi:hypothetical protein